MRNDGPVLDPMTLEQIGSFPKRLQEVIGTASYRDFGDRIGVSEGTVRNMLKGGSPKLETLVAIAREGGISLDELILGTKGNAAGTAAAVAVREFDEEYVLVPGYHVSVSAGHGAINGDEPVKRHLAFRRKWLSFKKLGGANLAVVFAKGDSMEPTINDNDSLLVNLDSTKPLDGKIFVVRLGDELYAKRIQIRWDGAIELISDNKEYRPQTVPAAELEQLHIVGQVAWIGKDIS
ncbi:LexA family transcriptional regulator [Gallaecimonas kandeliae]|uniref:XRE family transcriptional regulator n=1 Tax=Gallaecimonas kandeliae TaxID=3029055 RepID=UPI002649535D|nr:LexA family transcriptional regulator [Gallaecimonas kandeliae]WKE64366.1 LexA family transcriptional regulator [Gallaecimonas kandeliae]